ncbi:MAG: hypothetical protein KGJ84_08540 [Elusimicrobia bacterium]|nr:hypothetical protein [Elusimicrobiota bacterium]
MGSRLRIGALVSLCLAAGATGGAFWANGRNVEVEPAANWPADAPVSLDVSRPTLVLFVHPGSPEARATLKEVALLQKRLRGRVAVSVRVYRPAGPVAGWERLPVWKEAGAVSGDVAADPEGEIARSLGVNSAESAVVYAPSGRLLFQGQVVPRAGRGFSEAARLRRLLEAWRGLENGPVVGVSGVKSKA